MFCIKKWISIFLFFHIFLLSQASNATKGIIDIRNDSEFYSKPINLNGEWNFYWNKTYNDIVLDTGLKPAIICVPASWNSFNYNRYGYATYHLQILLNSTLNKSIGFYLPAVSNNYNLYINNKKCIQVGEFSSIEANAKPDYKPQTLLYTPTSDTLNLYIEVSNYFYREGGISYAIKIAEGNAMQKYFTQKTILGGFSVGVFFIMFVYFISFFFISRRDKLALYFALISLATCLRLASTGVIFLRHFLPISWNVLIKIEFISLYTLLAFGSLYISAFFYKQSNKIVLYIFNTINATIVFYTLLADINSSSYIIPFFKIYSIVQMLYLSIIIIKAIIKKEQFAVWFFSAYIIVFVACINDSMYSAGIINTAYMIPTAMFSFVLIMAFVVTRRFSQAYINTQALSEELFINNKNQELIIEKRTTEINKNTIELKHNNIVKDKILNIIAHDLKAPIKTLNQVLNWIEEDVELSLIEIKKYLKSINRNVDNLNLTIENLLTWSRKEFDGIQSVQTKFDIRTVIIQNLELFKLQAETKGIKITSQVSDRYEVMADTNHVHIIIRNLLSNAMKFSNTKGKISISAFQINNYVQVCVADNGVGLSSENLDKLFKLNEHFTTYGTANEKGTGLGLLLCKDYAEQNGGTLWVESELGIGTKVYFRLNIAN